jgi:hypothetical protein
MRNGVMVYSPVFSYILLFLISLQRTPVMCWSRGAKHFFYIHCTLYMYVFSTVFACGPQFIAYLARYLNKCW